MKKQLIVSILFTVILCGCSAKGSDEISETTVTKTSSAAVTDETSAKTETFTTTAASAETSVAKIAETAKEEILLSPIPSEEPLR